MSILLTDCVSCKCWHFLLKYQSERVTRCSVTLRRCYSVTPSTASSQLGWGRHNKLTSPSGRCVIPTGGETMENKCVRSVTINVSDWAVVYPSVCPSREIKETFCPCCLVVLVPLSLPYFLIHPRPPPSNSPLSGRL